MIRRGSSVWLLEGSPAGSFEKLSQWSLAVRSEPKRVVAAKTATGASIPEHEDR